MPPLVVLGTSPKVFSMGAQQIKERPVHHGFHPHAHLIQSKGTTKGRSKNREGTPSVFSDHNDVLIGSRSFADFHSTPPLPCPPPPGDSGDGGSISGGGVTRWASKEDLLNGSSSGVNASSGIDNEDPQLFVALYEFVPSGENQLPLEKEVEKELHHPPAPSTSARSSPSPSLSNLHSSTSFQSSSTSAANNPISKSTSATLREAMTAQSTSTANSSRGNHVFSSFKTGGRRSSNETDVSVAAVGDLAGRKSRSAGTGGQHVSRRATREGAMTDTESLSGAVPPVPEAQLRRRGKLAPLPPKRSSRLLTADLLAEAIGRQAEDLHSFRESSPFEDGEESGDQRRGTEEDLDATTADEDEPSDSVSRRRRRGGDDGSGRLPPAGSSSSPRAFPHQASAPAMGVSRGMERKALEQLRGSQEKKSTQVAALEVQNVRRAVNRYGTLPKTARIDAFLESLHGEQATTGVVTEEPCCRPASVSPEDLPLPPPPSSTKKKKDLPSPPRSHGDKQPPFVPRSKKPATTTPHTTPSFEFPPPPTDLPPPLEQGPFSLPQHITSTHPKPVPSPRLSKRTPQSASTSSIEKPPSSAPSFFGVQLRQSSEASHQSSDAKTACKSMDDLISSSPRKEQRPPLPGTTSGEGNNSPSLMSDFPSQVDLSHLRSSPKFPRPLPPRSSAHTHHQLPPRPSSISSSESLTSGGDGTGPRPNGRTSSSEGLEGAGSRRGSSGDSLEAEVVVSAAKKILGGRGKTALEKNLVSEIRERVQDNQQNGRRDSGTDNEEGEKRVVKPSDLKKTGATQTPTTEKQSASTTVSGIPRAVSATQSKASSSSSAKKVVTSDAGKPPPAPSEEKIDFSKIALRKVEVSPSKPKFLEEGFVQSVYAKPNIPPSCSKPKLTKGGGGGASVEARAAQLANMLDQPSDREYQKPIITKKGPGILASFRSSPNTHEEAKKLMQSEKKSSPPSTTKPPIISDGEACKTPTTDKRQSVGSISNLKRMWETSKPVSTISEAPQTPTSSQLPKAPSPSPPQNKPSIPAKPAVIPGKPTSQESSPLPQSSQPLPPSSAKGESELNPKRELILNLSETLAQSLTSPPATSAQHVLLCQRINLFHSKSSELASIGEISAQSKFRMKEHLEQLEKKAKEFRSAFGQPGYPDKIGKLHELIQEVVMLIKK
ncbi:unnamed protein product [Cyprideis torosa]|uniref:Uncharacterized protein n=1 Tax=Cyprideis torosa TaxID=163714 RepID=A0A7R8W813_9CRUS|nr:unnamed protein product [Cyprideis torosa]CAG0882959.1 unnamed protein product [Cyprideis torosa]